MPGDVYFISIDDATISTPTANVCIHAWSGVAGGNREYELRQYTCTDALDQFGLGQFSAPLLSNQTTVVTGNLPTSRTLVYEGEISKGDDWTVFYLAAPHIRFDYEVTVDPKVIGDSHLFPSPENR